MGLSEDFNSLKTSQAITPCNELVIESNDAEVAMSDEVQSKLVHLEFQSIVHQQLSSKIQSTHDKLQTKFDSKMKKYKATIKELQAEIDCHLLTIEDNEVTMHHYKNITELYRASSNDLKQSHAQCNAANTENNSLQQTLSELRMFVDETQNDLKSVTVEYDALLQTVNPLQEKHEGLMAEYELMSKTYTEIRDEHDKLRRHRHYKSIN